MYNIETRAAIKRAGFFHYEVASAMGMTEQNFSKMLSRRELSSKEQKEVQQALSKLSDERAAYEKEGN